MPAAESVNTFDDLYRLYLVIAVIVGILVLGYLAVILYRYRASRGSGADPEDAPRAGFALRDRGSGWPTYTIAGLMIVILFSLGISTLNAVHDLEDPPDDPATVWINVTAYRFSWDFEYDAGFSTPDFVIPIDTVVRLNITSTDVLHKFQVSAFAIGIDAVPYETTRLWFRALEIGTYSLRCAELCGLDHHNMITDLEVVSKTDFATWEADQLRAASGGPTQTLTITLTDGEIGSAAQMVAGYAVQITIENAGSATDHLEIAGSATGDLAPGESATLTIITPATPGSVGYTTATTNGSLTTVAVTLIDAELGNYYITLSSQEFTAGVPYLLRVTNTAATLHDIGIGDHAEDAILVASARIGFEETTEFLFVPAIGGSFDLWCTVPGHDLAGMLIEDVAVSP